MTREFMYYVINRASAYVVAGFDLAGDARRFRATLPSPGNYAIVPAGELPAAAWLAHFELRLSAA